MQYKCHIYIVGRSQQIHVFVFWNFEFLFPNVFNPQSVESSIVEPMGVEGWLYRWGYWYWLDVLACPSVGDSTAAFKVQCCIEAKKETYIGSVGP